MRYVSRGRGLTSAVIALVLMLQAAQLFAPDAAGHRQPEAAIYSRYVNPTITIDGNLAASEWSNATVVDLSVIPINLVAAYLLVQNNDTMLYIAFEVVGDLTEDANDSAAVSFDGDHNGAPTLLGDGEYSVKGSNDIQCLPYVSPRCHYTYLGVSMLWTAEDGMDQSKPFHSGLQGAIGFGASPWTSIPHRMYEFAIPLALIGQPTVLVRPGDVVGLYASRHASPYVGVWDAGTSGSDAWPDNAPLYPNGYGHLYLAARSGAAIAPDYSFKPATPSQPAAHQFAITNIGEGTDGFDLVAGSPHGWGVALLDDLGSPLTNHGGNVTYPDTGLIAQSATMAVVVVVTPLGSAPLGTVDSISLQVIPWSNPAASRFALLRSAIPLTAPWTDDLEGGAPSWYILPRPVNDWALGAPDPMFPAGPVSTHSGVAVWGTNLIGNYSFSSYSILESPFVRIPDFASSARLVFWHWYKIAGPYGDGAWVEINVDGGQWTQIDPTGLYPGYRFGGESAYTGASPGWVQETFNLTAYIGRAFAFRFTLWDWLPNGVTPGWYIDDVSVQAIVPSVGARMTPTSAFSVGSKNSTLEVQIQVTNVGMSTDTFDLSYSQSLNWPAAFLDVAYQPLTDTDTPKDGFVDTGPIPSGSSALVRLNVTIPVNATPGETETVTALFRSGLDIAVSVSGQYRFQLAMPLPFLDKMESGIDGWTVESGSLWHQVDSCQPSPPPWFISYSPCHSWWYGQDSYGNYETGARTLGNLTSPPIELSGISRAHLSFRSWYDTEPMLEFDQRWIMIRTDNGAWPDKGQPGSLNMGLPQSKTWLMQNVNLTPYVGHIIQVRFFFDSVDGQSNNYQGWYVDDVNVSEYTPGSVPPNIILMQPSQGDRWSGAQPQAVSWNATDEINPTSSLLVWVNYSLNGSAQWSPIPSANGVPGDSSPITWTPSCGSPTDSQIALNATAINTFGLSSSTGPIDLTLDCTRPNVLDYDPKGPTGVSVRSIVSVIFSEPMNVDAAQAAFAMHIVQGWADTDGNFSSVGNTLYFDPNADLRAATEYQVNISQGATDVSVPGNGLTAPFTWRFTTSSQSDQAPTITIAVPIGSEDWSGSTPTRPVLKTLAWTVTDDFDPQLSLRVWVNYTVDGGSWTPIGGLQPFNATLDSFIWLVPCVNSTTASIGIDAVDTGGRRNSSHSRAFQIDCKPPSVTDHQPTGNVVPPSTDILLQFDEPMDRTLTEAAFSLKQSSNWTPVAGTFLWTSNLLSFHPVPPGLIRGMQYQVNLTMLATDTSDPGNGIIGPITWGFTVAPSAPPKVNKTNPADRATGVSVDLNSIDITFSTGIFNPPLIAVNITPSVDFTIESSGSILVVHIWSKLSDNQRYTVTLKALYISDAFGNRLDGNGDGVGGDNYIFSFTTGQTSTTFLPEMLTWIIMIPLIVAGFALALAIYSWRRREEERKRRLRRKRRLKRQREEAMRRAKGEEEAKAGSEAGEAEKEPSESASPFRASR